MSTPAPVVTRTLIRQLREHEALAEKRRSAARECVAQARTKMGEAKALNAQAEKAMADVAKLERQCEELRAAIREAGTDPQGSIGGEPAKTVTRLDDPAVRLTW